MKHLNTYENDSFNSKSLTSYITEYIIKKKLDEPIYSEYKYHPQTKEELISNIDELLDKEISDFNCINTSNIIDMSDLFVEINKIKKINFNVSNWDVSNVENMSNIFSYCFAFDCDLSKWNVSNVTNTSCMFYYCHNFKAKGLENWNVSKVTHFEYMFSYCDNITDIDLSKWNVSNGMYFNLMFYKCENFKGNGLEKWSLDNAEYMSNMFEYCENFDCDVSNWKMSKAETIKYMFSYCVNFTGNGLNKWKLTPKTEINKALDHCNINKLPSWYKT